LILVSTGGRPRPPRLDYPEQTTRMLWPSLKSRVHVVGAVLALLFAGGVSALNSPGSAGAGLTGSTNGNSLDHVVALSVTKPSSPGYRRADIKVTLTEWLVAPGFTARQLHDKLKAQGIQGLVDPDSHDLNRAIAASVPAGYPPEPSNGCTYGTASTFICPPIHWARNGFVNPRVYFHDMSSSAWPVGTAITTWNQSARVAPRWVMTGCPILAGSHCVWVNSSGYGASGWLGITYLSWDGNLNLIDGSVGIRFNDYYPSTHLAVTCHEVGHALGMGHNGSTSSCLRTSNPTATTPTSGDFWVLDHMIYP